MVQIFTVEVNSTRLSLLCVFQTSPGLLPEAGFSYGDDSVPNVAVKKTSYTKSGKAQAARARKRIKSDAMSCAKKRKTGRSMNRN